MCMFPNAVCMVVLKYGPTLQASGTSGYTSVTKHLKKKKKREFDTVQLNLKKRFHWTRRKIHLKSQRFTLHKKVKSIFKSMQ